jgi:hypothetical protein
METKTEHTAGPWRRDYGGGYDKGHIYSDDPKFAGDSLAAAHFPPLYEGGKGGLNEESFAIMEANAKLIAAAPALLEVCKAAAAMPDGVSVMRWDEVRQQLKDAIALAEKGE